MRYALIMAGGKGRRLWPLSKSTNPKQFISLLNHKTLFELTYERLLGLYPRERIFVSTNHKDVERIKGLDKNIPHENILAEPEGKNTAPCIAYASAVINKLHSEAIITTFPSDHIIRPKAKFHKILRVANEIAYDKNVIVTLGLPPSFPSTNFGYIKKGKLLGEIRGQSYYNAEKFTEKPNIATAKKYYKAENYFWNSGIFTFKISTILESFKKYAPKQFKLFDFLEKKSNIQKHAVVKEFYAKSPKISFDYAILENSDNIVMLNADFFWDDLGDWNALQHFISKNKNGNIVIGNVIEEKSTNCIMFSNDNNHLIAAIGLDNIVIAQANNITLITTKDNAQNIKDLLKNLPPNNDMDKFL